MNILKIGAAALGFASALGATLPASAQPHVDHELLTGQQPLSASEFADILVKKLQTHAH